MDKEMKLALAIEQTETKLDLEHVAIVELQELEIFHIKSIHLYKMKNICCRELYSVISSLRMSCYRLRGLVLVIPREIFNKFLVSHTEHIVCHSPSGNETPTHYLLGYPIYITEDLIECLEEQGRMKLEQFKHWVK